MLLTTCAIMIVPFVWMVLTSVKSLAESTAVPLAVLPSEWRWSNYAEVLRVLPFGSFYLNSLINVAVRTTGLLLLSSLSAYAFARLRFPGRDVLFVLVLSVMMIPPEVLLIPQYQIMAGLGWLNSLQAVIAPGLFSALATFLLRQFFAGIPYEIEEAARIDGAGTLRVYWSIMLPMAAPGLIAAGVLKTLHAWNELLWPLVVNDSPSKLTLPAGLAFMKDENFTNFPLQMAGAVMAVLPVVVMFIVLQKYVVRGFVAAGGVK
ncbi:carbohydrate ABC transporter permease [Microlunatus parietis]|nr:carbohydrate ABC transporter permease [Microlunatus parietis]